MQLARHQPDLLRAFGVFQLHCEQLERSHQELTGQLRRAEAELAQHHVELQQRMAQIEQMRDRLNTIFATVEDAMLLVDEAGHIETANAAGQALDQAMPDGLASGPWAKCLAEPGAHRNVELACAIGGTERFFLVSVLPVPAGDTLRGRVVVVKDISAYRQMERRLAREDRLAALGKVAASVAHEVRNPLGAIEGFARLLVSDLRSQPQSQCLADKIVRAARQLNSVVGNLLTYTRDLPARSGAVELRALLHDLAGFYRATADDLGIALIVEPGPPLPVLGDPALLQQALTNVLVNAFDACPIRGQGRIVLAGQVVGDQVVVAISDNGCGMTPEVAERIFEPFFTIKDGGIGLGLALCQRIVESHRGQLGVVTQTGLGTTMRLSFPAHGDSHD